MKFNSSKYQREIPTVSIQKCMAPHYYITRNLLLVKAPGILIVRLTRQFLEDNVFYSDHGINRSQENKGSSPTDWKSYTCIPARDIKNLHLYCTEITRSQKVHNSRHHKSRCVDSAWLLGLFNSMYKHIQHAWTDKPSKSFNFTRNSVSNSHTKVLQIIFSRKFV